MEPAIATTTETTMTTMRKGRRRLESRDGGEVLATRLIIPPSDGGDYGSTVASRSRQRPLKLSRNAVTNMPSRSWICGSPDGL
jgi:hypothetical protein